MEKTDFLVLGSGIAGLFFAIKASQIGEVIIVTKKDKSESNTNYAQGGIACVFDKDDKFEYHIEDTLKAGAGLCHKDVVEMVVKEAPKRIKELISLGTKFTESKESPDTYELGKEGGHSRRRILHSGDFTGREIERTLLEKIPDTRPDFTELLEEEDEARHQKELISNALNKLSEKEKFVITGDVLFYQTIGRTDIPYSDYDTIINSIKTKLLVLPDNTKVFPARLYGNKEKTGARIEVFLLRELNQEQRLWDVMVEPARKIRIGNKLYFGDNDELVAEVIDNTTSRGRTLRFLFDGDYDSFKKTLYSLGETPLPRFIKHKLTMEVTKSGRKDNVSP